MANDRCKSHQSSSSRRWCYWWKSGYGQDKRGLNTKIHLAVDANGMPVRFFVTAGTTADCAVAAQLIGGFSAQYLLADRGYDTNEIIAFA